MRNLTSEETIGLIGKNIKNIPKLFVDPNTDEENATIRGNTFIKPKVTYQYEFIGVRGNKWTIDTKKYPVRYSINPKDDREIKLIWDSPYSGQFDITCGNVTKTIVVESLF